MDFVSRAMDSVRCTAHRAGDVVRENVGHIVGEKTESEFTTKGTMTMEEFRSAGDQLVFKFPTWQWNDEDDKTYLITKDVPCSKRVRSLDYDLDLGTTDEDGWAVPKMADHAHEAHDAAPGEVPDLDDLENKLDEPASDEASTRAAEEDELDDFVDLSDVNASLEEYDPSQARMVGRGAAKDAVASSPGAHVEQSRTYDLTITYDKYYCVPRLWLFGYDENHKPLDSEGVFEDILSDYIKKTVTVDPHPHTKLPTVSIHPCRHAQVMLKVVKDWIAEGIEPRVDLALFVFLKFISGVVPTINYDFTMDIEF